jgi:hypothetical protein
VTATSWNSAVSSGEKVAKSPFATAIGSTFNFVIPTSMVATPISAMNSRQAGSYLFVEDVETRN